MNEKHIAMAREAKFIKAPYDSFYVLTDDDLELYYNLVIADAVKEKDEALKLCVEAMTWELGGEPLDTLMLEARRKAKQALGE